MPPVFHRHGGDYVPESEVGERLRENARVARVLALTPAADVRYLLPPLAPAAPPAPAGTDNPADFRVRLTPPAPVAARDLPGYLLPPTLAALDFPRVVLHLSGAGARTVLLADAPETARAQSLDLVWSLPDLVSIADPVEAARDLRGYVAEAGRVAQSFGGTAAPLADPLGAATRAANLRVLLRAASVAGGMRLVPRAEGWASRDVWRAAYSLGMVWGTMDLFHWFGGQPAPQFRLLSSGTPAYFLPERAAEGERIPGLILEADPHTPDPLAVFDRMAIALAHLGAALGGRPVTRTGAELDGDRLDAERGSLEAAVAALRGAGIAPGSEGAGRFL